MFSAIEAEHCVKNVINAHRLYFVSSRLDSPCQVNMCAYKTQMRYTDIQFKYLLELAFCQLIIIYAKDRPVDAKGRKVTKFLPYMVFHYGCHFFCHFTTLPGPCKVVTECFHLPHYMKVPPVSLHVIC